MSRMTAFILWGGIVALFLVLLYQRSEARAQARELEYELAKKGACISIRSSWQSWKPADDDMPPPLGSMRYPAQY